MTAAGSQPLKNTKHEQFAQLVAQGAFQIDAFGQVGYKRDHGRARRLTRKDTVRERIAYIKSLAAEHTVVTLEHLIEQAQGIMKEARTLQQLGPAVGALKELGILCGFRVEKREQTVKTSPDELSDDELRAIAALAKPQLMIEGSVADLPSAELSAQGIEDAA